MTTTDELLAVIGSPVDSPAVRALVTTDALAATTEEDLEEGEPLRAYLSNPAAGYQLMHHSGRVAAVFLYAEPAEGFAAFPGPLPCGLSRGSSRAEVRARFGAPERSGEPFAFPGLRRQGAWDRFGVGDVYIHFHYTEPEQCVRLVTMMSDTPESTIRKSQPPDSP